MKTSPNRKPTRTYTMNTFCAALDTLGRPYKKRGTSVDVDWGLSGHFTHKCTPAKGVYITSSGAGGTIYQLLHSAGADLANSAQGVDTPPLAGCGEAKPKGKKSTKDLAKVIDDAFPRVLPEPIITGTSSQRIAARRTRSALEKAHAEAWCAVSTYLESRGLTLADVPAHAKVASVANGYDLIIPLTNLRPGEPAAHFTLLTRSGEKRPENWLDGDCRYTKGPQRTPDGGAAHAIIRAASDRQLEIPGVGPGPRYCIGEGLESAGSGNKLTGYTSIFAVTRGGVAAFLDDEIVAKGLANEKATLFILVDRDVSGDGQKSAAILARKAKKYGIPVFFCVPPMIVKGGKKSADWNDVLMALGIDGARGAMLSACAESEAALAEIPATFGNTDEYLQLAPNDEPGNARCKGSKSKPQLATLTTPTVPVVFHTRKDAANIVAHHAYRHIHDENNGKPVALAVSPGVGKSHLWANACDDAALLDDDIPTLTITPTRALALEAAEKNGGVDAPARTGVKGAYGYCNIHPEIAPFSDAWRSIVAHKCTDCEHGKASMCDLKIGNHNAEDFVDVDRCSYVLETENARRSTTLSCTGKKANVDEKVFAMKEKSKGKKGVARRAVADDFSELNEHKLIRSDQVAGWVRAASYVISRTVKSIVEVEKLVDTVPFMDIIDGDSSLDLDFLNSRKSGTEHLKVGIEHLLQFLAANPDDEQKQLSPADFAVFCDAAENQALDWMDGTSAEAVYKDKEGHLEIPLRAVRDTATAIRRGTAWVRKGSLHIAVPTFLPAMIKNGGMVMDATILPHVRMLIEAHGGEVVDVYAESRTRIRQHFDGEHSKTSCDPAGKNFEREKRNFLLALKAAIKEEGDPARICVISHMSFILKIKKDIVALGIPEEQVGWFNRHDRGQNDWYEAGCTRLVQWGVMRLSTSVAERMYNADRQAVIEAGGVAGASFAVDYAPKVYRIPGTEYEKEDEGYENEDVDRWIRSRITAQTMQASGRLRGTRRVDGSTELTHDIHSNFAFCEDYGFRVDEVVLEAAFDTRDTMNARRADDSERRAVVGLSAALKEWAGAGRVVKAPGRDKVNGYLKAENINEISSHTWNSVLKSLSVQALYDIYTMPARIAEKTGEIAYLTDLYGESVSKMYQAAVDSILSAGGDPVDPKAIRAHFDKIVNEGKYSGDLDVAEGLLMEAAMTIQKVLATGTGGNS